ncbi:MAG TPA: pyridoxamine 5'-phosphate oxidase [Acidimicrobiales bacterium]|nr:pyridoxamine 5'-phosphate oxidase [Acidimicrobiales bacterium]
MSERWVPLDVTTVDPSPFVQFQRWFDEASTEMPEREAVALATATTEGLPSVRMVLLRHHDGDSFGWFSNYESRKGEELAANPHAALLWYCEPRGRQIRIEGTVARMSTAQSDAYFATRARGSQLGAHASRQSQPLVDRETLERRVEEVGALFEGGDVRRPDFWGGFRLVPRRFEFWQHRDDRLHDRVIYQLADSAWCVERLSP